MSTSFDGVLGLTLGQASGIAGIQFGELPAAQYLVVGTDGEDLAGDTGEQVRLFGSQSNAWDGSWTVIAFSVPESSREIRDMFRSRLRWRFRVDGAFIYRPLSGMVRDPRGSFRKTMILPPR